MSLSDTAWRRIFLLKGAYNIIVSLALLIWSAQLLPLLGTPAGNPAYPQTVSYTHLTLPTTSRV